MSFLLVDSIFFVIHCVIESIHNSKKKYPISKFRQPSSQQSLYPRNHRHIFNSTTTFHLPPSLSNYTQNKSSCIHTLASNYPRTPHTCKSSHFPTFPPMNPSIYTFHVTH